MQINCIQTNIFFDITARQGLAGKPRGLPGKPLFQNAQDLLFGTGCEYLTLGGTTYHRLPSNRVFDDRERVRWPFPKIPDSQKVSLAYKSDLDGHQKIEKS